MQLQNPNYFRLFINVSSPTQTTWIVVSRLNSAKLSIYSESSQLNMAQQPQEQMLKMCSVFAQTNCTDAAALEQQDNSRGRGWQVSYAIYRVLQKSEKSDRQMGRKLNESLKEFLEESLAESLEESLKKSLK